MMRALLLVSLTALSGCISLLPEPPPPSRTFILEAQNVAALQGAPVDTVIGVAAPNGERAILGSDLIWRTGDSIAYVDQTQWSSRAEDSLQQMLTETLVRQGRFRAATRAGDARTDFEIRWEVLDFEVQEESMTARFVAEVRLVRQGRQIVASRIISAEAPVASRSSQVAADALARAAREGSARIGEFAADAVAEAMTSAAVEN